MKVLNGSTIVLMTGDEFRDLINEMPDSYIVKMAKQFGITKIDLPYTKEKLIYKIFIEAEQQVD